MIDPSPEGRAPNASDGAPRLCAKEIAIIAGLADGMQSKEIAARIQLSKASIDTYVRILFGKFGARSRAQLVALAYAAGVFEANAAPESRSYAASAPCANRTASHPR